MPVPFIDLRRYEDGFLERWADVSAGIAADAQFVGGPHVTALEARLASEAQVHSAVACANGTDALQLALRAVGVGAGDIVLIPDATFWATFEAVVNVGARVVTVDIDAIDLQMDFDLFVKAYETYRPRAAIIVHLYGWGSSQLAEFRAFCRERDLPLIEDGAQCWGTLWHDEPIYRDALISTVSFYPAKVLGACGDAGAVLCADEVMSHRVRSLGNHGRMSHYEHGLVGWNSRMGGFEAAWLELMLDYLDVRIEERKRVAALYRRSLSALGYLVSEPPESYEENAYLSVTLHDAEKRPAIEEALRERGIGYGIVYPGAMSRQPAAGPFLAGRVGGEKADTLARSVLNPPLFPGITDAEVEEVIAAFDAARANARPANPEQARAGSRTNTR